MVRGVPVREQQLSRCRATDQVCPCRERAGVGRWDFAARWGTLPVPRRRAEGREGSVLSEPASKAMRPVRVTRRDAVQWIVTVLPRSQGLGGPCRSPEEAKPRLGE